MAAPEPEKEDEDFSDRVSIWFWDLLHEGGPWTNDLNSPAPKAARSDA